MHYPDKENIFQIALLVVFGFFAVTGVLFLAFFRGQGTAAPITSQVVVWGPPFYGNAFTQSLREAGDDNPVFKNITYVVKNPATLYGDLLEAIASGRSPDLVILNSTGVLSLRNKLFPIPFSALPKSVYEETYIDGAKVFMLNDGIYAYPLLVDPLVLYWNKHLFANAAIPSAPRDWESFVQLVPKLSMITDGANLTQSAVAFGEFDNVLHAKEIVSTLFMQLGYSIVAQRDRGFYSDLTETKENARAESALTFYTAFSSPVRRNYYSWNKTFDRSREAFAANRVAMYGGFVSEERLLGEINPNLNYGMAVWPQSSNSYFSVTYGNFHGVGVLRSSRNPQDAMIAANLLSGHQFTSILSKNSLLPPVRKSSLALENQTDPHHRVKVQSAIISKSWLEPAPKSSTERIFQTAINNVVAGSRSPSAAVQAMRAELEALLRDYN